MLRWAVSHSLCLSDIVDRQTDRSLYLRMSESVRPISEQNSHCVTSALTLTCFGPVLSLPGDLQHRKMTAAGHTIMKNGHINDQNHS